MKTLKKKIRVIRQPFLVLDDGQVFADILFHQYQHLTVDFSKLAQRLATADPAEYIVARRLAGRELRMFREKRGDSDHEIHGHAINSEAVRWPKPAQRRRR